MMAEIEQEVIYKLSETLSPEQLAKVESTLIICLNKYDIRKKSTELTVYDHQDDGKIVRRYFANKKLSGLSDRSLSYYKTVFSMFFRRIEKPLKNITSDDVKLYLAEKSLKVSNVTLNNERRVLNSLFTFLVEEEVVTKNPMLKVKKIKEKKQIKKPFSDEEMEKMRIACKSKREEALIEILFSTGCRVSEISGANVEDVDFENREFKVLGKGNKERMVFLSVKAKLTLQSYLAGRDNGPLILSEKNGDRLLQGGIESVIRSIGKRANVSNAHPHRFRRTTATVAIRKGMPLNQVQTMLGHEDIKTTTIYAQTDMDAVKANHQRYL